MKRTLIVICAAVILIGVGAAMYFLVTAGDRGQGGKAPVPDASAAPEASTEPDGLDAPDTPGSKVEKDRPIVPEPAPEFDEDGLPFRIVIKLPEVPEKIMGPSPPIEQ